MKKVTVLFFFLVMGYNAQTQDLIGKARVENIDGIDVYMDCRPLAEYEVLGNIQVDICTPYNGCRNKVIKKAKTSYSQTDAVIILQMDTYKSLKAEAIKYKK